MTINHSTPPYRKDPIDVKAKGGYEEKMRFDTIGRIRIDPTPWPYTTMGSDVLRDLAEALPDEGNRPVVVSLPLVNNYERADSRAVVFSPVDEETLRPHSEIKCFGGSCRLLLTLRKSGSGCVPGWFSWR